MAGGWPTGGGKTGALIRALDWTRSPLGLPETWPAALRSAVSLLLASQVPMYVAWGPELVLLYNDACAELLGAKHPAALGAVMREALADVWPDIAPLIEAGLAGRATYCEDFPAVMNRRGREEQAWFTVSHSPIEGDGGRVAGVFCVVVETTGRMRTEQQRAFLLEFDDRIRDLDERDDILLTSAQAAGERVAADRVHWSAVEVARDRVKVAHDWVRPGVPSLIGDYRLSDLGELMIAELRAGRVAAIEDVADSALTDPDQIDAAFGPGLRSAVCVPLSRGGIWQATLCVHAMVPRRWREDELQLIRDIAEKAWTRAERARAEARVRDSEQRLRALVNATSDVTFRVSADWTELRELEGDNLPPIGDRPSLSEVRSHVPPEEQLRLDAAIGRARREKTAFELEHRVVLPDGSQRWARSWAVPMRNTAGEIVEWFGAASDVTEAHRARQALEETAERLQLATDAAEVGLWDLDVSTQTLIWEPRVKQMFGIAPDKPISLEDFFAGLHPDDRAWMEASFAEATDPDRRALFDVEFRTVGKEDRRIRWVAGKGRGIFDEAGRCVRVLGTAIEVTERKAAEANLRLMVNELNHRVKNSLATVQAITVQTLRRGVAADEVREALVARLMALAEAHDVLTDANWSGAELSELAAQAATPYVSLSGASPFEIRGAHVFLPPKTAIAMALAFHELATNAAKYGALSRPEGKVLVAWSVTVTPPGRVLHLTWRERGGPKVRPPKQTGFGTRLIQRGLASELQGEVVLDYQPTGLVCTMDAFLPDEPAEGWAVELEPS